jgi:hypothetical protein
MKQIFLTLAAICLIFGTVFLYCLITIPEQAVFCYGAGMVSMLFGFLFVKQSEKQ